MKIFVYGSLMRDFPNHHLLEEGGAVLLGEYESEEKLFMIGLKSRAYPYLIDESVHPSCQATTIKGEVYEVSYDLIKRLDAFEGHPYHYTRQTLIVFPRQSLGQSPSPQPLVRDEVHALASPNINKFQPIIAYTYMVINEFMKAEIEAAFDERFINVPDGDWKNLIAASAAKDN